MCIDVDAASGGELVYEEERSGRTAEEHSDGNKSSRVAPMSDP